MSAHPESTVLKTFSLEFVQAYVITMRPYLMFVSGITGLVGISFIPQVSVTDFILRFAASFLSYGFGQALTDCFQIDTDTLSSPYRPLTQGIISRLQAFVVSVVGLTFCISVFAAGNLSNLLLGAAAGTGLATYTYFKRRWWGGPFYNAWIVAVLCSMAFLSGAQPFSQLLSIPMIWVLLCVLFGYANFVLSGYFKDIEADRATGYHTLPVVFGRRLSAWTSDFLAVASVAFAAVILFAAGNSSHSLLGEIFKRVFFVAAALVSVIAQVRLHAVATDNEAHGAIAPVVHSYILLLSAVACAQKPAWTGFFILFYAAFIGVLKIRPAQNQI
jgi:geranylgeranylglycerol-phosphate geranylgeranyltransferase